MPTELESRLVESRERLLGLVRSKVSDPSLAEDILQDALLRALRSGPALRDNEKFLPWFRTILNHAIVDAYRSRAGYAKRTEPLGDRDFEASSEDDDREACECFKAILPAIKPGYAEIVQAELDEEPAEVTASRLGITANNLKVRRHRARQALRVRLEETCRTCAEHGCLDCTCDGARSHGTQL